MYKRQAWQSETLSQKKKKKKFIFKANIFPGAYTHLRAHETGKKIKSSLMLEKKKKKKKKYKNKI